MAPKTRIFSSLVIGVMLLSICSEAVWAGIVLQATRLVFPADAREVTLRINNTGETPLLAQTWVDDGDANKSPEELKVPFLLSPAVTRLDSGGAAVLRISYTKEPLPNDRESLFWLNVLETPPRQEVDENVLQFAFRTRIKVFFRPTHLSSHVDSAADKLSWALDRNGRSSPGNKGVQRPGIQVSNPTPYYVSFGRVEVALAGKHVSVGGGMVAPLSNEFFVLPETAPKDYRKASVRYEVINDYGGRRQLEKPLL